MSVFLSTEVPGSSPVSVKYYKVFPKYCDDAQNEVLNKSSIFDEMMMYFRKQPPYILGMFT